MSTLSASLKKWEKDPCTLFSVSQSISVTGTSFGMQKIDQGRHEGALTATIFSPHRHVFLIIGFVTRFLALFA